MAGATWIVFRFTTSAMPHVTRHTSHVTRHTSHVTRHTSHVTRHTSHVTRHTSHLTRLSAGVAHAAWYDVPHAGQRRSARAVDADAAHAPPRLPARPAIYARDAAAAGAAPPPLPHLIYVPTPPSLCSITPCKMPHQTPSRLLFPCRCRLSPESLKSPLSRFGGGVGVLASVTVLLRSKLIAGTTQMATHPPRQEEPQAPPPHPFLNCKPLTIFRRP
jgi:hypothetical protein